MFCPDTQTHGGDRECVRRVPAAGLGCAFTESGAGCPRRAARVAPEHSGQCRVPAEQPVLASRGERLFPRPVGKRHRLKALMLSSSKMEARSAWLSKGIGNWAAGSRFDPCFGQGLDPPEGIFWVPACLWARRFHECGFPGGLPSSRGSLVSASRVTDLLAQRRTHPYSK